MNPDRAPGALYVIAAPSGAGKTSLVKALLAAVPDLEVSVSHTTRPPRPGEQDGVHYHFVDAAAFESLVRQGVFLEHARVYDRYYGTSRQTVLERLAAGVDVILEIDWQGARQVRAQLPACRSIFILPPSREILRQRLHGRGQDSAAVIDRRMAQAVDEIAHYREFDYLVVNDDFAAALDALRAIFIANRHLQPAQALRQRRLIQALLS
ncbi:MAG: guanylate kinase [Pseudomonadota bacterium]|nr:guanylate kinase [Pseudomonadota bacterium]